MIRRLFGLILAAALLMGAAPEPAEEGEGTFFPVFTTSSSYHLPLFQILRGERIVIPVTPQNAGGDLTVPGMYVDGDIDTGITATGTADELAIVSGQRLLPQYRRDYRFGRRGFLNARAAFADLGLGTDGTQVWCSDCSQTSPCTSGGAGTLAVRQGSAWNCETLVGPGSLISMTVNQIPKWNGSTMVDSGFSDDGTDVTINYSGELALADDPAFDSYFWLTSNGADSDIIAESGRWRANFDNGTNGNPAWDARLSAAAGETNLQNGLAEITGTFPAMDGSDRQIGFLFTGTGSAPTGTDNFQFGISSNLGTNQANSFSVPYHAAGGMDAFFAVEEVFDTAFFEVPDLTADRTYTFPDASGTVSLVSGGSGTTDTIPKFGSPELVDSNLVNAGAPAAGSPGTVLDLSVALNNPGPSDTVNIFKIEVTEAEPVGRGVVNGLYIAPFEADDDAEDTFALRIGGDWQRNADGASIYFEKAAVAADAFMVSDSGFEFETDYDNTTGNNATIQINDLNDDQSNRLLNIGGGVGSLNGSDSFSVVESDGRVTATTGVDNIFNDFNAASQANASAGLVRSAYKITDSGGFGPSRYEFSLKSNNRIRFGAGAPAATGGDQFTFAGDDPPDLDPGADVSVIKVQMDGSEIDDGFENSANWNEFVGIDIEGLHALGYLGYVHNIAVKADFSDSSNSGAGENQNVALLALGNTSEDVDIWWAGSQRFNLRTHPDFDGDGSTDVPWTSTIYQNAFVTNVGGTPLGSIHFSGRTAGPLDGDIVLPGLSIDFRLSNNNNASTGTGNQIHPIEIQISDPHAGDTVLESTVLFVKSADPGLTDDLDNLFHFDAGAGNNFKLRLPDPTGDIDIDFPDASGTVALVAAGAGTQNVIPRFNATGGLIDGSLSDDGAGLLSLASGDLTFDTTNGYLRLEADDDISIQGVPGAANTTLLRGSEIRFEGPTADDFEVRIFVVDPTNDTTFRFDDWNKNGSGGSVYPLISRVAGGGIPEEAGAIWMHTQNSLKFEGTSADDFEGSIQGGDPSGDWVWTMPDATGTIAVVTSTADTLTKHGATEGELVDSDLVNADPPAAGASGNVFSSAVTFNAMDGNDAQAFFRLTPTGANHTGVNNHFSVIRIDKPIGDADATEAAIFVDMSAGGFNYMFECNGGPSGSCVWHSATGEEIVLESGGQIRMTTGAGNPITMDSDGSISADADNGISFHSGTGGGANQSLGLRTDDVVTGSVFGIHGIDSLTGTTTNWLMSSQPTVSPVLNGDDTVAIFHSSAGPSNSSTGTGNQYNIFSAGLGFNPATVDSVLVRAHGNLDALAVWNPDFGSFETRLEFAAPTVNRTITFPDAAGTVPVVSGTPSPAYGELYISTPVATNTTSATPVKAAGTTTLGHAAQFDMPANNRLRYTGATTTVFSCQANTSFVSSATPIASIFLADNGVVDATTEIARKISTGIDEGAASTGFLVELAQNEHVELWVDTSAGNPTVTFNHMTLRCSKVN